MQKKTMRPVLFLLLILSCTVKESSIGDINQLTIISSAKDRLESEHIIEHFFNQRFINTPQKEHIYSLKWANLEDLNNNKLNKNLLILSLTHPADSTIDILVEKLKNSNNISNKISSLTDLFAINQKTIILQSMDTIELESLLRTNFRWITSELNQNIYSNYHEYIVSKGRNVELESFLEDEFKILTFVQQDYKLIKNQDNFAWIGRGYPYRWIIFYQFKKNEVVQPVNLYNLFDNVLKDNNINIQIYNEYRKKTTLNYNSADLDVYRGIYDHEESQTGGPFALYLLDNINSDEVILVASIINNPGNTKITHLLQMDALVRNIKFLEEKK